MNYLEQHHFLPARGLCGGVVLEKEVPDPLEKSFMTKNRSKISGTAARVRARAGATTGAGAGANSVERAGAGAQVYTDLCLPERRYLCTSASADPGCRSQTPSCPSL